MKIATLLLVSCGVLAASPASALSFRWSFDPVAITPTPADGYHPITGTISGLVDGDNDGSLVVATVVDTPFAQSSGGGYTFFNTLGSGPAFTVTGGQVTFANALFKSASADLYIGTGSGAYTPKLDVYSGAAIVGDANTGSPESFAAISEPVPEPGVWAMMASGLGVIGAWRRRRQSISG